MKSATFALFCCTFASAQNRELSPAFKGIEMYSWKPAGQDWRFSFLPGTNRAKRPEELEDPRHTVAGLSDAKKKISMLATGEHLFWGNDPATPVPPEMVDEIRALCRSLKISLYAPTPADRHGGTRR